MAKKKFSFRASATISCWTEVEAETKKEAMLIAENRELSDLCHGPYTSEVDDAWHFDNDGLPTGIELEEKE